MKKEKFEVLDILVRYVILLLIGFFLMRYIYIIFTPLTLYPVLFILSIFFNVSVIGVKLVLPGICIELINACIAGSAYYLLLILSLSTPNIKIKKRLCLILFLFASFLLVNIVRILLLSFLIISNSYIFDFTHKVFLYLFSIIFVMGVWFLGVKMFNIQTTPFISDFKKLYLMSSFSKHRT